MAVTETIIHVIDYDTKEMLRRVTGCQGYLSSRAASSLNDGRDTAKLNAMLEIFNDTERRLKMLDTTHLHRTESAPIEQEAQPCTAS